MAVSSATVIKTPGNLGAKRLKPSSMAIAPAPNTSDVACIRSRLLITCQVSSRKCSVCLTDIPTSGGNCDRAMMIAAALMKPISTGCDSRLIAMPMRSRPKLSWNRPDRRARRTAWAMNASLPGDASGAMLAAVSSEVSATGPVDNCADEPNSAPTIEGSSEAYRP